MANQLVVGPILGFRGLTDGRWCTSALVVMLGDNTEPQLDYSVAEGPFQTASAKHLKSLKDRHVWRFEWSVAQTGAEQTVAYTINSGFGYEYVVPEKDKPLRIAYGSCFGYSSLKYMNKVKVKNAMWESLQGRHTTKTPDPKPFHLMMAGGDQVYADLMWETVPELSGFSALSIDDHPNAAFTPEMDRAVEEFYFDLYCQRWNQKEPAAVMSRIPMLMMWDDHDIFDGWGSYPAHQQASKVFQGIYKHAREHFRLFQLQAKDDADLGEATLLGKLGFTYGYRIGSIAILAFDMRSERTQDQVMSPETWNRVYAWMDKELTEYNKKNTKNPVKHLFVMSSIPVVYVNANMLEDAFGWLPGQQDLEDDFKDQWLSRTHMEERLRLIHRLLKFSKESACRVTVVSGDVHVAALGYIESERDPQFDEANVVNQLISSAMIHPPPAGIVVYMMEKVLGGKVEEVDRGITAQMLKFPGSAQRFLGARNWLSLTLDDQHRIWGEWYVEGEQKPYTKVIHPVGALSS